MSRVIVDDATKLASVDGSRTHPARVVIVEDNPATARALTELLEINGYQVTTAEDGATGGAGCTRIKCAVIRRREVSISPDST